MSNFKFLVDCVKEGPKKPAQTRVKCLYTYFDVKFQVSGRLCKRGTQKTCTD